MTIEGRILERALKLPPATTRRVRRTRNLSYPAYDGEVLVADLYEPKGVSDAPTVLVRTPYGRRTPVARLFAVPFAERGYNVVVAAVRGTDGSGGEFEPFANEREDGLATLDWIEMQPWHNGRLVMIGPSYLGYVQLAMAPDAGNRIDAIFPMITTSSFRDVWFQGGGFQLGAMLAWASRMVEQRRHGAWRAEIREFSGDKRAHEAMRTLPLSAGDQACVGETIDFYQRWMTDPDDSGYWLRSDHRERLSAIAAPTQFFSGWQDITLPSMLDDYDTMETAGHEPHLTIGPWTHQHFGQAPKALEEALVWFKAHTTGDHSALRKLPVRLFIEGADEWRDFTTYPPVEAARQTWHLQTGLLGLATEESITDAVDRFRYDPSDPTPDFGGASLDPKGAGRKDNAERESRDDVVVYTSEPLAARVEIAGPVHAEIRFRTSTPHADLFVRVCDVDEAGVSTNVTDGIQRVDPDNSAADTEGVRTTTVRLWPSGYRFERGHRMRVQVSGGSFPRFARNTGSGEPLGSATLQPVDYEILPGTAVVLPVLPS